MVVKTVLCANPQCSEFFETTNAKKKFCCLYCKNQAAYWYKQKFYKWEVEIQKGRLNNIRILEELNQRRFPKVISTELMKLGFDFKIALLPDKDELNRYAYRFGNLYLVQLSKSEFEIVELSKIKFSKNEN